MVERVPLPESLWRALASAWQVYQEALEARSVERPRAARRVAELARAGHDAGWSYPALAEPCGVSWQRIQLMVTDHPPQRRTVGPIPRIPRHPRLLPKPPRLPPTRRRPPALTARERDRLGRLARSAAQTRGTTRLRAKTRRDSEQFSQLLAELRKRKVPWRDLAAAAGVSESGLRRRLARHGYLATPPSLEAYRGVDIHRPDTPGQVD